uniref:Retrotransposon gag domain-containing protein n=1 Tax=Ananas comosus var. bracteatus TaxID=296719 RepID=A0A6V7NRZ3_ANACO|nr:unnamed protein product [Ananas comosus var. bracteatus]
MSTDEQIATPSDLAAKVAALSDDMKTVLDWIKTQSAAPSAMPVEKSGRLAETPPAKASVTPMKVAAEDTSGVREDDDFDDDESIAPSVAKGRSKPFKVKAKIKIPNYNGVVDAEKLDAWLDQLETYFDLYNYSNAKKVTFAKLKLVGHALTWWKATLQTTANEEFNWSQFKRPIRQEFYPMGMKKSDGSAGMSCAKDVTRQCRTTPLTFGAKPWHVKDRCWKLHPEMRPKKKDDRGKRTMTTATTSAGSTSDAPTLIGRIDKADTSLSLMAMPKETSLCPSNPTNKREELFTFRVQVKNEVIDAIINPDNQKNLISENLVQKLGLSTTPHPHLHPYPLVWINSNIEMKIDRQYKVKFAVTGVYIDEMLCEVVSLNIYNLISGSPYLWDRDAIFFRRPQQYQFVKDGQKFLFTTEPLSTIVDLVTACQAKRMINVCQKFALLVVRPVIAEEANSKILSLACKKNTDDVAKLIDEHQDLFQEVRGLPLKRAVEYEIQLISDAPLPNLGMYRNSVVENEEIK